jgi:ribosomal-protein-alanine N-acetyltransferase
MACLNFTPFPNLETERLRLRPLSLQDEKEIFLLRSSEEVNKYIGRPRANSLEDARQFIERIKEGISQNQSLYWVIELKQEQGLIGTICLWNLSIEEERAEIGYELLPGYQGNGYMQEAVARVIRHGFETMQLKEIEACPRADNYSSVKLLVKNSFKRDVDADARISPEEKEQGMIMYSRTNI